MRLLVLGGTSFVGRAIVEDALARGHDLTLFSRGKTGPGLFPAVARARGDRDTGDYASLAAGAWDAVVDVTAYVPRHVSQVLDAVAGRFGRYILISTGSVYDHAAVPAASMDESAARLAPELGTEDVNAETYGPLKVACEDVATTRLGDGATIVRPGIVAGPYDPTDRFTWWVRSASQGGRVSAPIRADQPVQVVDSRDLARLVVRLAEDDRPGTFNAVGPAEPVTAAELLLACASAAGVTAELVAGTPREGFPLALVDDARDPMFRRSAARAYAAGMPQTPLAVTAADVLAWDRARGLPQLAVS